MSAARRARAHAGRPATAEECELDVRLAIREAETAHAAYLMIIARRDLSDLDRAALMREARDKARLAAGFLADVLKRPAK